MAVETRAGPRTRVRFFAPEVIQTSNMDCGPAVLKCLLDGFGLPASYGRLREACQTDVDGTSIDTLEEVGVQLGLDAEQVLRPADHLLVPEARLFPAVVVVRNPRGETHFVVAWRRHGRWLQVMDPASGRRWPSAERFLSQVYAHAMEVPASDWHGWARSPDNLGVLRRQLAETGGAASAAGGLLDAAAGDDDWRALAALDAAARLTRTLVAAGGLGRGAAAARFLEATFETARDDPGTGRELLPEGFWSAVPAAAEGRVLVRGAVLVRVRGRRPGAAAEPGGAAAAGSPAPDAAGGGSEDPPPLSPELAAAVQEPDPGAGRELLRLLQADGGGRLWVLAAASVAAGAGLAAEALVLRSFLDLSGLLGVAAERLEAFAALVLLLAGLAGLEIPTALLALRSGRHLEIRLRRAFLHKLPRLGDRFFSSRPVSDMTERSHGIHAVRSLPALGGRLVQTFADLGFTTAGILWLDPGAWAPALALAAAAVAVPLFNHRLLAERDLRVRTHRGALGRFYLDVLLGASPARAHDARQAVRRSHEELLAELARGGFDLLRATVTGLGVQSFAVHALAVWLIFSHLDRSGSAGAVLLLVYWTLKIPGSGQQIALLARQYPPLRNATRRLMEPLGAPEDDPEAGGPAAEDGAGDAAPGVALDFDDAGVRASGHTLLEGVRWTVPAGTHAAIVGPSGAGKSTLLGLLLGWHRPFRGRVEVDGEPLSGAALQNLRRRTAWVDPAVRLWNRSLLANLCYGAPGADLRATGRALAGAHLYPVVEKLPSGLRTRLGEGGRRLSGGEGQRVRLGRGLARPAVRLALLDEPFRGLDRETRQELLATARRRWREATLLCITHDVEDSLDFDRVLVLENGRVAEEGRPRELLARTDSRYRRMIEAGHEVRAGLLRGPAWRRLWLDGGRLSAGSGDEPPDPEPRR